jgi:hypothetical protein
MKIPLRKGVGVTRESVMDNGREKIKREIS